MELLSQPRKILIVDDNPIDRETCRRFLSRASPPGTYHFIEHDSLDGALEVARAEKPDCILLDYHLHDGTGVEFLQGLYNAGKPLDLPVVMLTGTGSESIAVEVMKIGAQDYLVKDRLTADVLQRTVEGAIYRAHTEQLIEGQRKEMERLFGEAQEAHARKDHFLATLSHELRTPLTPVLASVALLDEAADRPDEVRRIAAIIRRNIELEARLIDDMLDLTKISKGKLEVALSPVDIREVIRCTLETCRDDIEGRKLRVVLNFHVSSLFVSGNEPRLQQVFWNLLQNAAKFTPEGGTITIFTDGQEEDWTEIHVRDTGIGIPPSELRNIFLSFEQGSVSINKRFGGLGLGLAISRGLIEAHGGLIWAENAPGGTGAQFNVRLKTARQPTETPALAPGAETPSLPATPRSTVLVIEDHDDSSFFFRRIITRMGHTVLGARNAAEALEVFSNHSVDCIISDIGLPDSSGLELLPRLHAIRPVPAIALSGYGMEEDLLRSREAGFSRHLIKPITSAVLAAAVNELLKPPAPERGGLSAG